MKAISIYVVLAMVLSSLAATTPVQNNRVGGNRFGGFGNQGNQGSRGGQNGQQNRGSNKNNNNNQNGQNSSTSNNQNGGAGGAATGANNGSNQNQNQNQGQNQNQANNTAGASNNSGSNDSDAQTSLTLNPKVIASGFANNGQANATAGQVPSLTSTNNFINFCLTAPNLPLTNGQQITTGSCNPAPMGVIPSTDNMPSAKFVFPKNGDTIQENTDFTIQMAISNMETGNFVNAEENYFSAPQQVNAQGQIVGHSHVVIESLSALDQTTTTDPRKFSFFKGLNAAAVNGVLTADVSSGLPAGFYKLSSINTAANHQPVLVPIAQHGSLDDAIYFTVTANGQAANNGTAAAGANNTGAAGGAGGSTGTATGAGAKSSGTTGAANNNNNAGGAQNGAGATNNGNNKSQGNNNQNQKGANTGEQRTANTGGGRGGQGQRGRGRRSVRQL